MSSTEPIKEKTIQPNSPAQETDYKALAIMAGVDAKTAARLDHVSRKELENFIDELNGRQIELKRVDLAKSKLLDIVELKRKLELADRAPRCTHIKSDGQPCRSAAIKGEQFCYFHGEARAQREAAKAREIPVLDGPHGVQLAIMRVCNLLASGTIDEKTARALFDGLRLAQQALLVCSIA